MVVVEEVLHADQERVYSPRPRHRKVLGIVPGKMETFKCHRFMKFLPVFMGDYEIKYFTKLIT